MSEKLDTVTIFGVPVTSASIYKILEYITTSLQKRDGKLFITTPNPEIIIRAQKDPEFMRVLREADIALADGVGVLLAGRLLGTPIHSRITGVDFMKNLCETAAKNADSIALLGSREGVAEETAKCLKREYPQLSIIFASEKWPEGSLSTKKIDILFVALGAPRQEEWIYKNLPKIPVRVAMGVGGSFDYISGKTLRAPAVVRLLGFEWLFRLIHEPWRWKRQVALIEYGMLLLSTLIKPRKKTS